MASSTGAPASRRFSKLTPLTTRPASTSRHAMTRVARLMSATVPIARYPPSVPLATRDPAAALAEAVRLVGVREPRCGVTTIVAVDGPSGAGKSTLGAAVGAALDAPVVHLDDIYPGWDGLADAVPLVTTQVLEPLAAGRPAAYRRWSWVRHEWSRGVVPVPATPVL